jgi:CheY-like chemotaxis protein
MGGSISIDSKVGKGTSVNFTMVAPHASAALTDIGKAHTTAQENYHILLAEDDSDISGIMVILLEQANMQVTHVENGALAVDAVKSHQFDMILMDVHMPVLDGYSAIEQINQLDNDAPIVVMSATPMEAAKGKVEELGCDGYLLKPVDVHDILSLIKQLAITRH